MMAAGSIDIDNPGKYPIVLSDELLGKATEETFTSIRYNHKPDLGSTSSLSSLQLQPSTSAPSSYNLSFSDDAGKYKYNGIRTSGDGQYVLIFDPENKRFVLHRIDSTFDMNLISAPWEKSASTLQSQYSQLESAANPRSEVPQRKPSKSSKNTVITKPEPKRRKSTQVKKKPPVRDPTPEEEEDSDDGLTVEYPDAPSSRQYKPQPNSIPRRKTIENDSEEDGDEDADAEGELEEPGNQDVDHFKLPSPANNNTGGMSDEDIELDLEAELEQALKETTEGAGEDESDESEEE